MEALNGMLAEGKIVAGGVLAGQKRHLFIVDEEWIDEVADLVQGLPFWEVHRWQITPLESWAQHLDFLKSNGNQ